jgi:outer membrane protein assembly factor BamB
MAWIKIYWCAVVYFMIGVLASTAQIPFATSGDVEIDSMRLVKVKMDDQSTFAKRALLLKLWAAALQQQGADILDRYIQIDDTIRSIESFNPVFTGGEFKPMTEAQQVRYSRIIDKGISILDSIQHEIKDKSIYIPTVEVESTTTTSITDWPQYKANAQRTGFTPDGGPSLGEVGWRFPIGLAWESSPKLTKDLVYVASPGIRHTLFAFDKKTGERVLRATQTPDIKGDQLYSSPASASTPIIVGLEVAIREMGSRGNRGIAKDVNFYDLTSGSLTRSIEAGHIDYRMGYAPMAADDKYLVIPYGKQDIEEKPPFTQPPIRIICKDFKTGSLLWDYNIGPFFSEPVLDNARIYVGAETGYVYCLKADGKFPAVSDARIAWSFKTGGSVNKKGLVYKNLYIVGSNDGYVYALYTKDGTLAWKYKTDGQQKAYRCFSTPASYGNFIAIGSADYKVYVLNPTSGDLVISILASDWVRAAPAIDQNGLYYATLRGMISKHDIQGKPLWSKKLGNHGIHSDLIQDETSIYITDGDLYLYRVDKKDGSIVWKKSIINSFEKDGHRILTDQIAGGAYYQSKPTAAQKLIYIGSPSRFIYAIDHASGVERWKFELSAAVSGAPVVYKNRVYIGQQGGDEKFYCLDAQSGQKIWEQNIGWVWGSVNVDDDLVFIPGVDGYVNCLDATNGRIKWRYRTERSTCSEPLLVGDMVYFGSWDHYLYSFEKKTGKVLRKYQVSGGLDSGSPISAEGKIFMPVGGASFRCLDHKSGEVLWYPKFAATVFNVTPAYHDSIVYISTLNGRGLGGVPIGAKVYALRSRDGHKLWEHKGLGGLTGPVVSGSGKLYAGSTVLPYFFCLSAIGNGDGTTNELWRVYVGNKVEESVPCIYGDTAYILSSDGYLYAIK